MRKVREGPTMKRIPLTRNQFALVDDEDFKPLSKYKWFAHNANTNYFYAATNIDGKTVLMHRLIMNMHGKNPQQIDHANHDTLDNRKLNLRGCTKQQNAFNQKMHFDNRSGYKGVTTQKCGKHIVRVTKSRKVYYCGFFVDAKEAALAYNIKAKELFGEYALLNVV